MGIKKVAYKEPDDFIPESIQKEFKVGKYWENPDQKKAEEKRELNKQFRNYVKEDK